MTEDGLRRSIEPKKIWSSPAMRARLRRRHAKDLGFRYVGLASILFAMSVLVIVLVSIGSRGIGAFARTEVQLAIRFDEQHIGAVAALSGSELDAALIDADFGAVVRDALQRKFPEAQGRRDLRALQALVSSGARKLLRAQVRATPSIVGQEQLLWLPADDEVDLFLRTGGLDGEVSGGRISEPQAAWLRALDAEGRLRRSFNAGFFVNGDSREPELAGILGAFVGSVLALSVTLLVAFPLGVSAALYLEEFAPDNPWTRLIEVNVNNLAAVPSIVFGLLGLAVFLGTFQMPRSAPVVGGLTLALMTLPTIIISGRAALKGVPPSIREAAIGVGASPMQVVLDHVLPAAMPGILTGTILGTARALGETAPLLMIGMVAFVVDIPRSFTDAATALPVQVYLWADSPARAFVEKTAGAIIVLLGLLLAMNAAAVWLRQRYEVKW